MIKESGEKLNGRLIRSCAGKYGGLDRGWGGRVKYGVPGITAFLIEEPELLKTQEEFSANPGIGGGVSNLLRRQLGPGPVGSGRALGDTKSEQLPSQTADA